MIDYYFLKQTESQLHTILNKLIVQEIKMATIQEILEATRAEQNLIKAALDKNNALVTEVKQLLAANNIEGAQQLLDDIQANSAALVEAVNENADLTALVDAVNGDPQPEPETEPEPPITE